MKTVKKSYKIKAGDILVIKPSTIKDKLYTLALQLISKITKTNKPKGSSTGLVIENNNSLQVLVEYKNKFAIVPLSALEVVTYMVPKNDYNKEERTKISDIVIDDFENYTAVKFTSKLKGIASYIFGTNSVVLNEDFEDAINKVRPSTFKKESVIPFVMELVNSKYYVFIDKKHRRISK